MGDLLAHGESRWGWGRGWAGLEEWGKTARWGLSRRTWGATGRCEKSRGWGRERGGGGNGSRDGEQDGERREVYIVGRGVDGSPRKNWTAGREVDGRAGRAGHAGTTRLRARTGSRTSATPCDAVASGDARTGCVSPD